MRNLHFVRSEIARMRVQLKRQQREIRQLEEAGISTESANALLGRMEATIDGLRTTRDSLLAEERLKSPVYISGKRIQGTPARRRA